MINIAVFFGGESCEHDISIITGLQFISKLNEYLYNIIPIYIDKLGQWRVGKNLKDLDNYPDNLGKTIKVGIVNNDSTLYKVNSKKKLTKYADIDVAVLCLHGINGEDGSISAILEASKIPYINSSIMPSSVAMDKIIFNYLCKGLGVDKIDFVDVSIDDYESDEQQIIDELIEFGLPFIIKPSRLGSSIGISVCKSVEEINIALKQAFEYDDKLVVERYINVKKEVNIACFLNKGELVFSKTEEPINHKEILDFNQKYVSTTNGMESMKRICPANISKELELKIKSTAGLIYKKLDMFGVVRFDFIVDDNDNVLLNETNTIPGSMANYLFDEIYNYPKLIDLLVTNALIREEKKLARKKTFESNVLKQGFSGFKK